MQASAPYRLESHGILITQAFDLGCMNEPFRLGNQKHFLAKNEHESRTIS